MQKIVFVKPDDDSRSMSSEAEVINELLSEGWRVISVSPQCVAVAIACSSYAKETRFGSFLVVLEKLD
jgi:hypothetical protein